MTSCHLIVALRNHLAFRPAFRAHDFLSDRATREPDKDLSSAGQESVGPQRQFGHIRFLKTREQFLLWHMAAKCEAQYD
jgi:hypothetical protein